MTLENEDRHELILNTILNKEKITTEELNIDEFKDHYEKIERYKNYLDLLAADFLVGINEIQKEKSSNDFIDYMDRFLEVGKVDFMTNLGPYLSSLPVSNGSRYFKKLPYRIGIVSDEFLYNSYKDVAEMIYIPYNFEMVEMSFDFVIIATTWNGIDGSWKGVSKEMTPERNRLYELIRELKRQAVPVVFYSKEDPVNYEIFKNIAVLCDFIYTSAAEMVEVYKKYCKTEHVSVLQFGINPHYHNPVGTRSAISVEKKDEVIFAGSWMRKYPVRNEESQKIFEAIINNGTELTIIDRNLHLNNPHYYFPAEFISNLTYSVTHEQLQQLHKVFRWAINVNSVKYSSTMFANRVFELQAFGNLLLSNYSIGVNNQFPNVMMMNSEKDFAIAFNNLNERELSYLRSKGIRSVMSKETTYHRIEQMAADLNLEKHTIADKPIFVVAEITPSVKEQFEQQSYDNKILVSIQEFENLNIEEEAFITHFTSDFYYEEYYLDDMISAFKYTDVDFVTKTDDASVHHNYISQYVIGKTMFDVKSYKNNNIKLGYALDTVELLTSVEQNYKIQHAKELSVIIPIHNNGVYLEDKCFASLKRSSIFNKMEIIFVNDGSTDIETKRIIKRLLRQNPDIKYFEYDDASGSASRPRNKGVELSTTPFITYLDPDNEATGDGYSILLEQMRQDDTLDMVVGNMIKEDSEKKSLFNYYKLATRYNNGSPVITQPKSFMESSILSAQSIQALIVKTSIVKDNLIKMVEGAAGQDTLFFQELLLNSRKTLIVNEDIHVYYAAVTGSVTNSVSKKLFDKYYILEQERIPFLKKYGLMDVYMESRFNYYIKGWYLPRLEKIIESERQAAITRFLDIYHLYDNYRRPEDLELLHIIGQLEKEVNMPTK
ncbi:glycosyltransferase [Macrococcus lamae]|uniref:Glycosyltransferase n=1 Tax=Macrococcus lamae TaxID=198484 RepID=A0A4R6BVT6_9STAP|nr:glycosyltransferase [Macrococcus lamae]TDM12396.1 glycosyltransferase [Macrococcus lamae]